MHKGECLSYPPIGFFKTKIYNSKENEIEIFKSCEFPCKTCSDEKTCTSCSDNYRFINSKCFPPCGEKLVKLK